MAAPAMNPTIAACDRKSIRKPSLHTNQHATIVNIKIKELNTKLSLKDRALNFHE